MIHKFRKEWKTNKEILQRKNYCKGLILQKIHLENLWPVWKFREGGEGRRVEERRVEENDSSLPYLDIFKISKGEESK